MSMRAFTLAIVLAMGASLCHAMNITSQLSSSPDLERDQRKLFTLVGEGLSAFEFKFKDVTGPARVNNTAVLQLQQDKFFNKFLATLPGQGQSQFLTVIKPCGILLPHVHQRATEFYSVIFGTMSAGIAQENGGLQNITLSVGPGEVLVVPQGLLHYNHNNRCTPLAFYQTFNSGDAGALNVMNALAQFKANPDATAAMTASTAQGVLPSKFGAFELDSACTTKCGWGPTGSAPGDGLGGLPANIRVLFGL